MRLLKNIKSIKINIFNNLAQILRFKKILAFQFFEFFRDLFERRKKTIDILQPNSSFRSESLEESPKHSDKSKSKARKYEPKK